jgi:hypothetical protein
MFPDSDPDPTIFVIDLQHQQKTILKKLSASYVLFEGAFASFFKDKSKRRHETVRIRDFLTSFAKMI